MAGNIRYPSKAGKLYCLALAALPYRAAL